MLLLAYLLLVSVDLLVELLVCLEHRLQLALLLSSLHLGAEELLNLLVHFFLLYPPPCPGTGIAPLRSNLVGALIVGEFSLSTPVI